MGFPGSSSSPRQFKSVCLRTSEEIVRLYDDVTEARRLFWQRLDYDWRHGGSTCVGMIADPAWKGIQDLILDLDQRMKRLEKDALFSEVVAGVMLQFEKRICPTVEREVRSFYAGNPFWSETYLNGQKYLLQDLLEAFAECVSSELESAHKVLVSALALLSFVYQYLIGCVGKGGSKTYSPGSFLFRLIFVAIVLFLGSYVWIKCRQASYTASRRKRKLRDESDVPGRVYTRAVKNSSGSITHKYEPRFKPLREKAESGTTLKFECLSLGSYDTRREAEIVLLIAAVLYGEVEGRPVQFEDGLCLPFPSVTEPEKCPPSGKKKADWVTHETKELYGGLLRERARRWQPFHAVVETGSHHGHAGEASRRGSSPSAPGAPSTAMELTCITSPHGGNGVGEQATTSESHGLAQEALLAHEVFPYFFSDFAVNQVISSLPQPEDNDFPAMDDLDKAEGHCSETERVHGFESPSVPRQSNALDIPTTAILGSLPQLGVGDQGLEIIQPHLNSATAISVQQLESLPEQVQLQQHVTYQETHLEEFSGSDVELQQKLLESEERNSELQQKLRKAEAENEKWRSMFRQLAKLI